jgi:GTPase
VPWFKRQDPNAIPTEFQPHLSDVNTASDQAATSAPEIAPQSGTAIRISGVYHIYGIGVIVAGKVEAGTVRIPMRFHVVAGKGSPTGPMTVDVVAIEMHHRALTAVHQGDVAGFKLSGLPDVTRPERLLRTGDLLVAAEPTS